MTVSLWDEEIWFLEFANFLGVNTPAVADFKLPEWSLSMELGSEAQENGIRQCFHDPDTVVINNLMSHNNS